MSDQLQLFSAARPALRRVRDTVQFWLGTHKDSWISQEDSPPLFVSRRTLLRSLAPELPIIPVVQGWTLGDYLDCVEMYERAGVDLTRERVVGVGSVCRRQAMMSATIILMHLHDLGLRLHAFGYKQEGLPMAAKYIVSADSMAWSKNGKYRLLDGHDKPGPRRRTGHKNCANCKEFALAWREDLLDLEVAA